MTHSSSMIYYSRNPVTACYNYNFLPNSGSRQGGSITPFVDDGASKLIIHNDRTIEFRPETFAHRLGREGAVLADRAVALVSAIGSKVSVAASHIWQRWPSFSCPGAQAASSETKIKTYESWAVSDFESSGGIIIKQDGKSVTIIEEEIESGEPDSGSISAMGVAETVKAVQPKPAETKKKRNGSIIRCPGRNKMDIPGPTNLIEMSRNRLMFKDGAGHLHDIKEQGRYEVIDSSGGGALEVRRISSCSE